MSENEKFAAKLQGMIAVSDKIKKYGHDSTTSWYTTNDYGVIVAILDSIVSEDIKVNIEMRNIAVSSLLSKDETELMYHTTAENINFWFYAEHCSAIKFMLEPGLINVILKF